MEGFLFMFHGLQSNRVHTSHKYDLYLKFWRLKLFSLTNWIGPSIGFCEFTLKGLFNRKYGKFDHFLKIAYLFYYPIRCPFPLGYTRIGMMPIC